MNKNQRKILEFLKDKDASKFYSNEEIADETGLSTTTVGSECYKMRKAGLVEPRGGELNVELKHRILVAGQDQLDEEELSKKTFTWTKGGTITALVLSIIAIVIAAAK